MNKALQQKKEALEKLKQKIDLRSAKTKNKYKKYLMNNKKINCIYCDRELFVCEFKYWIILENRFPYDKIAETCHMLAPKRHVAREDDLNEDEKEELLKIKKEKVAFYDIIMQSTVSATSRPDHFHLHLLRYKRL